MQVEIGLLGAVELRVDGRVVTPGAGKRRAMFAGLALAANRTVSLTRLSELVWADAPPASATANLRSYAAGLRRVLGHRLVARPNAYQLHLEPHELDVVEFQRLAEDGRGRLADRDPVGAIAALTAALGCWRGAAGEGLPRGTALDNRWASLEEQRLQVVEELADARLSAGKHADLVGELREHLAGNPLRERAWGQLMLALYRCGDVPAALTAYRHVRAAIGEQLGIEPGEELAALHRAILERAPEISFTQSSTRPPASPTPVVEPALNSGVARPVPRELPADLVTFVGRRRETVEIATGLTGDGPAVVVVTGPPGSGKTALAVHAAHAVAGEFPDGQVFVDLGYRTSMTSSEVLARVLRALGVAPADVPDDADERAGWFRSLTVGRRLLLVIDGVAGSAQVRPLLPAGPGPALLAVGLRYLGSLNGVGRVALRPLGATSARALLAALVSADRLVADPVATDQLICLCAGSMLALRIAGSKLARWPDIPVAALVGQLADGGGRLDLLTYDDLSVRASLATGVRLVCSEDELVGRLLELLAAGPEAMGMVNRAAMHLGVSAQRVRRALEDLVDAHLVTWDGPSGYRLPPLVREYAVELAAASSEPAPPPVRGNPALTLLTGSG